MAQDESGKIYDFFNGQEDLKNKIRNAVQITRKNNGVKDLEID